MTTCASRVYWYDGEYEGECELEMPHLPVPHWDGLSWWDEWGNDVTAQMEARHEVRPTMAEPGEAEVHDLRAGPDPARPVGRADLPD